MQQNSIGNVGTNQGNDHTIMISTAKVQFLVEELHNQAQRIEVSQSKMFQAMTNVIEKLGDQLFVQNQ